MERISVTVSVADRTITLEGPEDFVRQEVERLAVQPDTGSARSEVGASATQNERAFYASKSPKNHAESVAVFGFWLASNGEAEFGERDIRRMYLRVGVRPPKVVAQALRDAKNKFDYIESGQTRGSFRLTDHGDRTVRFDLPRN